MLHLIKKFAVVLRGILLVALLIVTATVNARPLDEVVESGTVTIFVYSDYAPYSWEDETGAHGIDVEIGRAIAKYLGVDVEFLIRGADENLDDDLRVNIWKGDLIHRRFADVMLHVPFDREVDVRNELAVLSSPYFQEKMALVHNAENLPKVETFGRFLNNPIAVELDTAGDFFLSNAFRGQLHQSIRRGRTFQDAQDLYTTGKVNALLASQAQTQWVAFEARKNGIESVISQPPMPGIVRTGWPIGIAVKHDSRDLAYAVGDALSELVDSGQMKGIYERYGVSWHAPELK